MDSIEFRSFKGGFLGAMEEDFTLSLIDRGLPSVDFKAPDLDSFLEAVLVESEPILNSKKIKKVYLSPLDYAALGADLYVALVYDSSYTAFEETDLLDKYGIDLNFDYETGEYHDIGVYLLG